MMSCCSPKGLGELLGANRSVGELQFVEHPLQRQRHALGRVVALGGHLVDSLQRKSSSAQFKQARRANAEAVSKQGRREKGPEDIHKAIIGAVSSCIDCSCSLYSKYFKGVLQLNSGSLYNGT